MLSVREMLRRLPHGGADGCPPLEAKTPWVCAQCYQCGVRCPKNVDITRIMEAIRLLKLRKNINHIKLERVKKNLPQIAMVSATRKYTG